MNEWRKAIAVLALFAIVLAFTAPALARAQGSTTAMERSNKDVMGALIDNKDTSMAAAIMKTSGLEGIAMPGGQYTLFVASDTALKATSPGVMSTMEEKLKDREFATYFVKGHLANGRVLPGEIADSRTLGLMNGKTMTVRNADGRLMADDANIVKAIETRNGVIYVMDRIPSAIMAMVEG